MKLGWLEVALQRITDGQPASDVEDQTLDFKQDPATGDHPAANPEAKLAELLVDATVCFANARGGVIVLGVADKGAGGGAFLGTNADVETLRRRIYVKTGVTVIAQEERFAGRRLVVIEVPEGLDLVTDSRGRARVREGTDCRQLTEDERHQLSYDRRNPDPTAKPSSRGVSDIDREAMAGLRDRLRGLADLRQEMADLNDGALLRALNLTAGDDQLLVAGEILLCRPRTDTIDLLTRTSVGSEPTVLRMREPLVLALPRAVLQVSRGLTPEVGHVGLPDGQEIALPDYSPIAVDEAITNALVHRDWTSPQSVVIDHAPQALRVTSPGSLPVGLSADRLLSTVSIPRNPALMAAMQQLGLVERASRGIDRMFREQIRVGQSEPTITADDFHVEVLFTSGAPNRAFAGFVAGLPVARRASVDVMIVLRELCQRRFVDVEKTASLLQVGDVEAQHKMEALSTGEAPITMPDTRGPRLRWRLCPEALAGLGTAVAYRARAEESRVKVQAHLKEYGFITNRTVRNLFDLDVQQARLLLSELRDERVIKKDPTMPQRGPTARWIPHDA